MLWLEIDKIINTLKYQFFGHSNLFVTLISFHFQWLSINLKGVPNGCKNSILFILSSYHPSFTIYIRKGAESTNWQCLA